jgi:hypothetical protein
MLHTSIPAWLKITIFLGILALLGFFGDLFTFIVGTLVMILIFSNGYDSDQSEHH